MYLSFASAVYICRAYLLYLYDVVCICRLYPSLVSFNCIYRLHQYSASVVLYLLFLSWAFMGPRAQIYVGKPSSRRCDVAAASFAAGDVRGAASFEPHSFGRAWAHRHEDMFGWGVFLFGTQQIDIGAGGPFCTIFDSQNVGFDKHQTLVR